MDVITLFKTSLHCLKQDLGDQSVLNERDDVWTSLHCLKQDLGDHSVLNERDDVWTS